MQQTVSAQLICNADRIMVHHVPDNAVKLVRLLRMKHRMPRGNSHAFDIFLRALTRKADPDVHPRIFFIRLIKAHLPRLDQESAACFQRIFLALHFKYPPAAEHIMDQIVRLHRRSEAVQRFCPGAPTASHEKLSAGLSSKFQFICFFHTDLHLQALCAKNPAQFTGTPHACGT